MGQHLQCTKIVLNQCVTFYDTGFNYLLGKKSFPGLLDNYIVPIFSVAAFKGNMWTERIKAPNFFQRFTRTYRLIL